MAGGIEEVAEWNGRALFDANAENIGTIIGLGYPRPKFGTAWLLVETPAAVALLVPAKQISDRDGRLVLPYPKTYLEDGPAAVGGRPLSREDERRLCLHYGLESALPNSGCRQGCGFCMAERRAKRRR
jgi:hypothetical protein